jgi:hypothetical protein
MQSCIREAPKTVPDRAHVFGLVMTSVTSPPSHFWLGYTASKDHRNTLYSLALVMETTRDSDFTVPGSYLKAHRMRDRARVSSLPKWFRKAMALRG